MIRRLFCVLALIALSALRAAGTTYDVGEGLSCTNLAQVPWANLAPGDKVRIHWRASSYNEKWVVCRAGTSNAPIVIQGVANSFGELPVIDGRNAVTPAPLNYWGEERSLLKIGGANTPPDLTPEWIVVENLDFRSARPPYAFTNDNRQQASYVSNAAAVFVEKGRHITIRNCILRDSGNGLFVSAGDRVTSNILVEGCRIYDNGNPTSIYEHNNYTEASEITFQYNWFGPLRAGCSGNNLKDRSSGTVIRYNWIEGGNRQLDLVESDYFTGEPGYTNTWVYGNILVEPGNDGNSQIVHYGGDNGDTALYRKGMLHFFNNTVISARSGNTTLFRLSTADERCDARNNIVYVSGSGSTLAMIDSDGTLDLACNWFKTGWVNCHGTLNGTVNNLGGNITGAAPGFVDYASQDFHLADSAACIGAGTAFPAPVLRQYLKIRRSEPRPSDAAPDIGAYEWKPGVYQRDDLVFIHHSCGANWLAAGLDPALQARDYVDERNDIYYGTDLSPDAGRPDSLASTPGDQTDMQHWIRWFNDYLGGVRTFGCSNGTNRIIMFKSCYPNSAVTEDGVEPGDPFSSVRSVANNKAIFRHPGGAGCSYTNGGFAYRPLEDVFASNAATLFIVVTAPPLTYSGTTDADAHRARVFNNWLRTDWLSAYNAAHPGANNVAVFDWFDFLAYPDSDGAHPNRLKQEYGGSGGDAHPNALANSNSTAVFAWIQRNAIDMAWDAFQHADLDGDEMPDWWERRYSGDAGDMSPDNDTDLDGARDGQECVAGTDPTNPVSRLEVSACDAGNQAPGKFIMSWQSVPGRTYFLQEAADLTDGFNTNLAAGIPATPPVNVHTGEMATATQEFYRIKVTWR